MFKRMEDGAPAVRHRRTYVRAPEIRIERRMRRAESQRAKRWDIEVCSVAARAAGAEPQRRKRDGARFLASRQWAGRTLGASDRTALRSAEATFGGSGRSQGRTNDASSVRSAEARFAGRSDVSSGAVPGPAGDGSRPGNQVRAPRRFSPSRMVGRKEVSSAGRAVAMTWQKGRDWYWPQNRSATRQ